MEVEEEGEEGEDQLRRRLLFDVVSSLSLDCIHQRQENEGKKGKTCQLYRSQKMCLGFGPKSPKKRPTGGTVAEREEEGERTNRFWLYTPTARKE